MSSSSNCLLRNETMCDPTTLTWNATFPSAFLVYTCVSRKTLFLSGSAPNACSKYRAISSICPCAPSSSRSAVGSTAPASCCTVLSAILLRLYVCSLESKKNSFSHENRQRLKRRTSVTPQKNHNQPSCPAPQTPGINPISTPFSFELL